MHGTWRHVFRLYEHVTPSFLDVKHRYEELLDYWKEDEKEIHQLKEAWRLAKQEYESKKTTA